VEVDGWRGIGEGYRRESKYFNIYSLCNTLVTVRDGDIVHLPSSDKRCSAQISDWSNTSAALSIIIGAVSRAATG